MQQYFVEAAIIGIGGGLLGIVLTWLGLKGIDGLIMEDLGGFLAIDWQMALTAVGLAIVATLITSIYPTWRACSVQPSVYLKSN
jgi:putative ABC transport system permease protein